jgi:predicted nucleotidyltransferase
MAFNRYIAVLTELANAGIDFIIVGGVAAVIDGAPISTFDVDIVHSRTPENIARLEPFLESIDAVFRIQPERQLRPTASYLAGPGHLLLITRYGKLDVLGTIGSGLAYADLLPHSALMEIAPDIRVRVLDLETIIALKEELGRDKDRAVLDVLRRTLAEKRALGKT